MARVPVTTDKKTLEKKSFSLSNFKKESGLNEGVKDKDLTWITLSPAFQEATGSPGIPKGYVSISRGHSNTGKTTSLMEAFVSCQKMGIVPVWIDTENNFNWGHAREMGAEFEEICDEETGEVISYKGEFIYINNEYLINHFGKKIDKNRDEATIENVKDFCHSLLDQQAKGELPCELCFLWDSVGTLDCEKSLQSDKGNNMWNAGAMASSFMSLLNARIPGSRKEGRAYTNSFFVVQKIWMAPNPIGIASIKHKGGDSVWYASRFLLHFGGHNGASTKRLTATIKGRTYGWGTQVALKCVKNHVTGVELEGEIISTPHGFIGADKESVDNYKKEHRDYLVRMCEVEDDGSEIVFEERELAEGE